MTDHDDEEVTHASLAAYSETVCVRCGVKVYYDPNTSWWMDATGVPGCAPAADGTILQHDADWTPEHKAAMAAYEQRERRDCEGPWWGSEMPPLS